MRTAAFYQIQYIKVIFLSYFGECGLPGLHLVASTITWRPGVAVPYSHTLSSNQGHDGGVGARAGPQTTVTALVVGISPQRHNDSPGLFRLEKADLFNN